MSVNVFDILQKVYGAKGIVFPQKPITKQGITSAAGFKAFTSPYIDTLENEGVLRKYTDESLGKYEYMPVEIDGVAIPNAIISMSGEKEIIETSVLGALDKDNKIVGGTVFEKVFTKPYDITIIATLIGESGEDYPESKMVALTNLWKKDDVVTIKSALSSFFLQSENNAIITKIAVLDNAGAENVEVIQFDLRSNIDFELEFTA